MGALQRLESEKIIDHQSIRGRDGAIAVINEAHWTGSSRPSWGREKDLQLPRQLMLLFWLALRTIAAKLTAYTVRCALGLHNGSFLVLAASEFGAWLWLRAPR